MASANVGLDTAMLALSLLDEMVQHQRKKVREVARRIHPGLTDEDVRNIHDFPDVYQDPTFQFEGGQLAGFVAAHIAIKARLLGAAFAQG